MTLESLNNAFDRYNNAIRLTAEETDTLLVDLDQQLDPDALVALLQQILPPWQSLQDKQEASITALKSQLDSLG